MDTPFMTAIAHGLAGTGLAGMGLAGTGLSGTGVRVVRFEFPFMAARRRGQRPPPDRMPVLQATFRTVVAELRASHPSLTIFIGGKSMGGRVAAMIADEMAIAGVVVLGYPFHPTGKPGLNAARTGVVAHITTPLLICQGERDPLGNRAFVESLPLSPTVQLNWLPDGDHSFKPRQAGGKPRQASGISETANWQAAIVAARAFMTGAAHA